MSEDAVEIQIKDSDGRVYAVQPGAVQATVAVQPVIKVDPDKQPMVKIEPQEEPDEPTVSCPRCAKPFYNITALRNHHKIQHGEELTAQETAALRGATRVPRAPDLTGPPPRSLPASAALAASIDPHMPSNSIDRRVAIESILQMEPKKLVSLASEDISYIIIKTAASVSGPESKRRRAGGAARAASAGGCVGGAAEGGAPLGEPVQLTGPFECLQRSSYLPSGTCHQIFFNCCEYSLHFRQEHSKRRKPGLRCQVCERQLDGMASATDTAHTCSLCQQPFVTAEALAEHTRAAHARPKPFQCRVCLKSFTQQGGLQQHMRMHTGDRPFPCAVCGKAFTQKAGLDQHLRIHTKLKPFRCVVCDKSFSQSVHLKQHMRTHTNIQPFQCGACGRRFKQSSHLNFHLKSHQSGGVGGELAAGGGEGEEEEGGAEGEAEHEYALDEPAAETILG